MLCFCLDLANALTNPIAYQTQLEKHKQQLKILTENFDVEESESEEAPTVSMLPLSSPPSSRRLPRLVASLVSSPLITTPLSLPHQLQPGCFSWCFLVLLIRL